MAHIPRLDASNYFVSSDEESFTPPSRSSNPTPPSQPRLIAPFSPNVSPQASPRRDPPLLVRPIVLRDRTDATAFLIQQIEALNISSKTTPKIAQEEKEEYKSAFKNRLAPCAVDESDDEELPLPPPPQSPLPQPPSGLSPYFQTPMPVPPCTPSSATSPAFRSPTPPSTSPNVSPFKGLSSSPLPFVAANPKQVLKRPRALHIHQEDGGSEKVQQTFKRQLTTFSKQEKAPIVLLNRKPFHQGPDDGGQKALFSLGKRKKVLPDRGGFKQLKPEAPFVFNVAKADDAPLGEPQLPQNGE